MVAPLSGPRWCPQFLDVYVAYIYLQHLHGLIKCNSDEINQPRVATTRLDPRLYS